MPGHSVLLASNAHSAVQAIEITHDGGTFWGVQYHPEYGLDQMAAIIERGWQGMVAAGLLPNREAVDHHAGEWRALHEDPVRRDIAWRLGIQREILLPDLRLTELRNWIEHAVRPAKSRLGRA